jgi:glycogen debranching enzyme
MSVPLPLQAIPFTATDSFLTFKQTETGAIQYGTCSSQARSPRGLPFWANDFFRLDLVRDGTEIPYQASASATTLHLDAPDGIRAEFAFANPETVVFEVRGAALRLTPLKAFPTEHWPDRHQVALYDFVGQGMHQLRAGPGTKLTAQLAATPDGLTHLHSSYPRQVTFSGRSGATGAIRFGRYEVQWTGPLPGLKQAVAAQEKSLQAWMSKMPVVAKPYVEAARLAWLLPWYNRVPAVGALTRPTIYCSKLYMNATWAWDNCFHALEVAGADSTLAWDQLHLFFDHQSPDGLIPDVINDLESKPGFLKPPIYGWTVLKLVEKLGLKNSRPHLKALYEPMCRQTEWWFRFRDRNRDGFCAYNHGNDSGWDNATLFDQGYPTEGSDLAAHLVLQMEALGTMASALGKASQADSWRTKARRHLTQLLRQRTRRGRFFSPREGKTGTPPCLSLLNYIPVELGARLPASLLKNLVRDLSPGGPYLTEHGLATESPRSSKYESDGYWRGPIWGPPTYLIFDGLVHAGQVDLARTIAERYCRLCVQSPGFWENYDALTGKGLRCPGYSWTAACFLFMAEWLATRE